jgi:hypothetical protein
MNYFFVKSALLFIFLLEATWKEYWGVLRSDGWKKYTTNKRFHIYPLTLSKRKSTKLSKKDKKEKKKLYTTGSI